MNCSQAPEIEAASLLVVVLLFKSFMNKVIRALRPLMKYLLRRKCCIEKSCRRKGDLMESQGPEQAFPLVCETKDGEVIDLTSQQ